MENIVVCFEDALEAKIKKLERIREAKLNLNVQLRLLSEHLLATKSELFLTYSDLVGNWKFGRIEFRNDKGSITIIGQTINFVVDSYITCWDVEQADIVLEKLVTTLVGLSNENNKERK